MGKQKKYNYILVQSGGVAKFVTSIEPENKVCRWEKDKKPLALSKEYAEQITLGLNLNFTPAFVITSFFKIEEQLFVKEGKKNEKAQA